MGLPVTACFERRLANDELVGKDAKAPDVHLVIVGDAVLATPGKHLRRQVVERAAHCLSAILRRVHAPTEVCQFYRAQTVEQVLWFQVPVDHIARMDVLESLNDLIDVVRGLFFCVVTVGLSLHLPVELTLRAILEDKVNLLLVVEEAVKLEDVFVSQMALNFDLAPQLVGDVRLLELTLEEYFERDDELAAFFASQVDMAEFPTSESLSDLKIIDRPRPLTRAGLF